MTKGVRVMFKKVLAAMLSAMMIVGAGTVCCYAEDGAETIGTETADSVVVNTVYGEVEVPYAPERICVLDLSMMDIIDALGIGDKVVVLQWHKHYPSYLEEYYNSETIISLTNGNNGHGGAAETAEDENADPYEMYYSIDADIIIGTTEKITEDLYAVLSQIAPTVVLDPAMESSENLYLAVRENAETIASIWGLESELETELTSYDDIYAQLADAVNGKSYVMTNGNTDLGLLQIGSARNYYDTAKTGEKSDSTEAKTGEKSDSAEAKTEEKSDSAEVKAEENAKSAETAENKDTANASGNKKKDNTANICAFLDQFGMTNVSKEVSEDASAENISAAVEAGTSNEEAAALAVEAINAVNPDSVFVFNYSYSNLDEIQEAGFDIAGLDELACPTGFVSIELSYTSGGLTAVTTMLDLMSEMFLA